MISKNFIIIIIIIIIININIIMTTDYCNHDYRENAHVFLPPLATTGAARVAQMRRFSLQFCEKVILKVIVAKICNGKIKGLAK